MTIELYFRHDDGLDKYVIDDVTKDFDDDIESDHVVNGNVTNDIRRIDGMEFVSCNNVAMLSFTRLSNDSRDDRERYWW